VNDEAVRIWKGQSYQIWRYYPSIPVERLGKTMKNISQVS